MKTKITPVSLHPQVLPPGHWPGLSITALPAPGVARCHPQAAKAQADVAEFARHWGIVPPTFEAYNTMFAYVYPDTTLERLVTIGKIFCLFFYLDDVLLDVADSERPVSRLQAIGSCLKVLHTGLLPTQPSRLEQAVRAVRQEIVAQADEAWLRRFGATVAGYLQSSREVSAKSGLGSEFNSLEYYLRFRELDSGTYTGMDLIEFAQGVYLPEKALLHPALQDLRRLAAWIWAGMNDLVSYHKEVALSRSGSNMLNWLVANQKLRLDQAAEEVVKLINALVAEFKAKVTALPCWDWDEVSLNRAVQLYVAGLEAFVAAAWHWQLSTPRYRSVGSLLMELRRPVLIENTIGKGKDS